MTDNSKEINVESSCGEKKWNITNVASSIITIASIIGVLSSLLIIFFLHKIDMIEVLPNIGDSAILNVGMTFYAVFVFFVILVYLLFLPSLAIFAVDSSLPFDVDLKKIKVGFFVLNFVSVLFLVLFAWMSLNAILYVFVVVSSLSFIYILYLVKGKKEIKTNYRHGNKIKGFYSACFFSWVMAWGLVLTEIIIITTVAFTNKTYHADEDIWLFLGFFVFIFMFSLGVNFKNKKERKAQPIIAGIILVLAMFSTNISSFFTYIVMSYVGITSAEIKSYEVSTKTEGKKLLEGFLLLNVSGKKIICKEKLLDEFSKVFSFHVDLFDVKDEVKVDYQGECARVLDNDILSIKNR